MSGLLTEYFKYCKAYWSEINEATSGPLKEALASIQPEIYRRSGHLLVFPARDGMVGVCFERGFKFPDGHFNEWLPELDPEMVIGPFVSVVTCSHSKVLTVAQWVQVFTGNAVKIQISGQSEPANVRVYNFPQFPGIIAENPETREQSFVRLFSIINDTPNELGLSLRDVVLEEEDSKNVIRPFWWMQLDIYQDGALRRLTANQGRLHASREIIALLAAKNLGMTRPTVSSDPINPAVIRLEQLAAEFRQLLDSDINESDLQRYLEANPIMFCPDFVRCIPHPQFGAEFEPDFILLRPAPGSHDTECVLVEIEPAGTELFTKAGDVTAPVNHALGQVRDWRGWLRENGAYAKNSLDLPNLHAEARAFVVVGRNRGLSAEQKGLLENLNIELGRRTEIITYDDLLTRLQGLIDNLKAVSRKFSKPSG